MKVTNKDLEHVELESCCCLISSLSTCCSLVSDPACHKLHFCATVCDCLWLWAQCEVKKWMTDTQMTLISRSCQTSTLCEFRPLWFRCIQQLIFTSWKERGKTVQHVSQLFVQWLCLRGAENNKNKTNEEQIIENIPATADSLTAVYQKSSWEIFFILIGESAILQ